ncbi:MAG: cytochrome c biogenesis protein CcsA [Chitinophagales bacterium]
MDTQFIGEHLRPGQLGHFFVITSFVAALFSAFSYFRAVRSEQADPANSRSWLLLGRGGFMLHAASVVSIFIALFYIIENHLFEYHYAWSHSSLSLPGKYLLACFWEGQEGSFMLWTFWHCALGLVVMRTAKGLETRTMAIIAMVQVCLATMILGIYFGNDIKLGSTPFALLRQVMRDAPIFSSPDYMNFIRDGNGLNVSLRNYWMVIHPPVLFLGFAATLIPFAYCIAALWKGEYQTFIKPALAWSLFNGAVLGTGIMMGGAWAYESLNFGGYWAWDPVENASLVPWLTLIAGMHTLIIYKSTGRALTLTLVLLLLTHLLVWYSTFLTRTGILGKTSVHAFTGEGNFLYYHLLIVIAILIVLVKAMLIWRWKSLPRIKTEEEALTREFWMFIGSVILFLSSIQIAISTSIPVWAPLAKWITGKDFAPPTDPMLHYNNIQVWVAIIIGILSAAALYMRFKHSDGKVIAKRLGLTAAIALAMAVGIKFGQSITTWQYELLLFAACFGIVSNIYYGIAVQKAKFKKLGPAVSHLGFAMVLLGILLSSYNKHAISFNITGDEFNPGKRTAAENAKENSENELIFRGVPAPMGDYRVTYLNDSESIKGKDRIIYYNISFERKDSVTKKALEHFTLHPDAFINSKGEGVLTVNPSTKHYWNYDIFTYLNNIHGGLLDKNKTDTISYKSHIVHKPGDTVFLNSGYMVFNGLSREINDKRYVPVDSDLVVAAKFTVHDKLAKEVHEVAPIYILRNRRDVLHIEDTVSSMFLNVRFENLIVKSLDSVATEISVKQTDADFVVLKALVFPYINVLWLGIVVMVFGFFISLGNLLTKKTDNKFPVANQPLK